MNRIGKAARFKIYQSQSQHNQEGPSILLIMKDFLNTECKGKSLALSVTKFGQNCLLNPDFNYYLFVQLLSDWNDHLKQFANEKKMERWKILTSSSLRRPQVTWSGSRGWPRWSRPRGAEIKSTNKFECKLFLQARQFYNWILRT